MMRSERLWWYGENGSEGEGEVGCRLDEKMEGAVFCDVSYVNKGGGELMWWL